MTSKRLVLVALTMCLLTLGACADDDGDDARSDPDTEAAAASDGPGEPTAEQSEAIAAVARECEQNSE